MNRTILRRKRRMDDGQKKLLKLLCDKHMELRWMARQVIVDFVIYFLRKVDYIFVRTFVSIY